MDSDSLEKSAMKTHRTPNLQGVRKVGLHFPTPGNARKWWEIGIYKDCRHFPPTLLKTRHRATALNCKPTLRTLCILHSYPSSSVRTHVLVTSLSFSGSFLLECSLLVYLLSFDDRNSSLSPPFFQLLPDEFLNVDSVLEEALHALVREKRRAPFGGKSRNGEKMLERGNKITGRDTILDLNIPDAYGHSVYREGQK